MTAAPDAAALCSARWASSPQHEPKMARFSPALDRAPFGQETARMGRVRLGPGFAHHARGVQFLEDDQVVIFDQASGDLLRPVAAAVGDGGGDLGHGAARVVPPPRPLACAQLLLKRQVPGGPAAADPWRPECCPPEVTSAVRTPRSIPTGPPPVRRASAGCGAGNETCQRPARSTLTRAMPRSAGRARVHRNRTHPHLGTCTSPQRRVTRRTLVSRTTNPCGPRLPRYLGLPAGLPGRKNAAIAWSKSRSACCCTDDEPSASHGSAARAGPAAAHVPHYPARLPRPGHHHDCCSHSQIPHKPGIRTMAHRTPTCAAAGYSRFLTATAADHTPGLRQQAATAAELERAAGQHRTSWSDAGSRARPQDAVRARLALGAGLSAVPGAGSPGWRPAPAPAPSR